MDMNLKIGVVGLGLIGGSIFKALCALRCNVYATSKSISTMVSAKKYSPNVFQSVHDLKHCDVIFVCTPMNKTIEILDKLDRILPPTTIVADVCSLKGFLSNKKYSYKFIPTHPMAGTESDGFDNAFESLFQGAKWVLTPPENIEDKDIETVTDIIKVLGSTPVIADAIEHDEAVALISHMPMLISQALFKTAQGNDLALKLASSGFRDMTRLAISNEEMANDMINLNSENIQNALLKLYSSVGQLLNNDYRTQIKEIKSERKRMYIDGKNSL